MLMPVEGELNIYTASTWKDKLLARQEAEASLDLELSAINEFDSAGLQVLILVQREARKQGKILRLIAPSRCVSEVLDLCQLRAHFDIVTAPTESDRE